MSDVLIKGAEMPISCVRCPCCDDNYNFCRAAKEFIPMLGKPKFCPLVEIPPHGKMNEQEAAKIVFERFKKTNLFCGTYDAKNDSEEFMYGVCTVMEAIAQMVSEDEFDEFDELFFTNMEKSEVKAKEEQEHE